MRMATPRGRIPVIVGTFEASGGRGGGRIPLGGGRNAERRRKNRDNGKENGNYRAYWAI